MGVTIAGETMQVFPKEVSEFKLFVKKLGEENREVRDICDAHGVQNEEGLAAHRRSPGFPHLCARLPKKRTAKAADVLGSTSTNRRVRCFRIADRND